MLLLQNINKNSQNINSRWGLWLWIVTNVKGLSSMALDKHMGGIIRETVMFHPKNGDMKGCSPPHECWHLQTYIAKGLAISIGYFVCHLLDAVAAASHITFLSLPWHKESEYEQITSETKSSILIPIPGEVTDLNHWIHS